MVNKSVDKSRTERIALHYKGFISSLQSWLELRIELAGQQYWERILQNKRIIYAVLFTGLSVVLAVTFILVAAAIGLGALLGNTAWGFASVGVVMAILAWFLGRPLVRARENEATAVDEITDKKNGRDEAERNK
jgi:VIT1/CCC1 family predicted Fe2+/Mn2+ transporter